MRKAVHPAPPGDSMLDQHCWSALRFTRAANPKQTGQVTARCSMGSELSVSSARWLVNRRNANANKIRNM